MTSALLLRVDSSNRASASAYPSDLGLEVLLVACRRQPPTFLLGKDRRREGACLRPPSESAYAPI
jgi:hypothetical protein